jgi:hypothetical protein
MSINLFKAIIYLPDNVMDRIILQNNTPMLSKAMEIYCLGPLVINVVVILMCLILFKNTIPLLTNGGYVVLCD